MDLAEKAMLMRLNISQWTARKYDRKVSKEVNERYQAAHQASRTNKLLVPHSMLHPVERATNQARLYATTHTSPWLDDGVRVLSSKSYFNFLEVMMKHKHNFQKAVETFVTDYDDFRGTDAQNYMAGMYNLTDYPAADRIEKKFSFDVRFMPIPSNNDWRVETDEEVKTELKEQMEEQMRDAEARIQEDITARITSKVQHIYDHMVYGDRFRRNSFDALEVLAELLPSLNVMDDPRITEIIHDLHELSAADASEIRGDNKYRRDVATEADTILKKMEVFTDGNVSDRAGTRETSKSEEPISAHAAILRSFTPSPEMARDRQPPRPNDGDKWNASLLES